MRKFLECESVHTRFCRKVKNFSFILNKRKMNYYFTNFSTKSREIKELILPYLNLFELQNKLIFCEDIYSCEDEESTPEKKVPSPCGSISNKLSLSIFLEWKVFLPLFSDFGPKMEGGIFTVHFHDISGEIYFMKIVPRENLFEIDIKYYFGKNIFRLFFKKGVLCDEFIRCCNEFIDYNYDERKMSLQSLFKIYYSFSALTIKKLIENIFPFINVASYASRYGYLSTYGESEKEKEKKENIVKAKEEIQFLKYVENNYRYRDVALLEEVVLFIYEEEELSFLTFILTKIVIEEARRKYRQSLLSKVK